MNKNITYHLEFRVWNGSAYEWRDYTSYLVSFDPISIKLESSPVMNSFTASMSSVTLDNSDGFWSNGMDAYLSNPSEPYGNSIRKRRIRIKAVIGDTVTSETRYLFTGLVDNLTYDNYTGKAKLSVISLDRNAMEQKCDKDYIDNTSIVGSWGTAKLLEARDANDNTGEYTCTWFNDKCYIDMLIRTCEALGDADYDIDLIEQATAADRRVCTTREEIDDGGITLGRQIFYSPIHGEILISTISAGYTLRIFSYNTENRTLTWRVDISQSDTSTGAFAFWYNTESEKVFFLKRYSTTTFTLCQLNADWTVNTQAITVSGFAGNVCYNQARNSGNGSIFISGGPDYNIYEYSCYDISSSFTLLDTLSTSSKAVGKLAISIAGDILAYLHPINTTTDDIWIYSIDVDTEYQLFDAPTDMAIDAMMFSDPAITTDLMLYIIKFHVTDYTDYRACLFTTLELLATETDIFIETEQYRTLAGFIRAGDGIYLYEASMYDESTAYPVKPTYLLAIKDSDYDAVVYENKITSEATYGEAVVDGEAAISKVTSKLFNKRNMYYLGATYKSGTDWAIYDITPNGHILYQYANTLAPYCRMYDLTGLSVWQFRKLLAERFGAVMFYGGDGTFYFKKRTGTDTVAYQFNNNISLPVISCGYGEIKNTVTAIPYKMPIGQAENISLSPWGIVNPSSTIALSEIIIGGFDHQCQPMVRPANIDNGIFNL